MQRHPYFDLWLHDEDELSQVLGCRVVERETLHEWPLSCVQRLRGADGQTHIYKAQAQPTVEPELYARARAPLLPLARVLPVDGQPPALLLEDIRAPRLCDLGLTPAEALPIVDAVVEGISHIEGSLPAMFDIRTQELWLALAQGIAGDIHALVEEGSFRRVDGAAAAQIEAQARSAALLAAMDGPTGYTHTDLRAENILVLAEGFKVLDWQRPVWGPTALDRASLLQSLGIDPAEHISPGVLRLGALLQIGWLAACARRWFTAGADTYDRQIAAMIAQW